MARAAAVVDTEIDKDQLALALARNQVGEKLPIDEVLANQNCSTHTAERYLSDPTFVAHVKALAKELTEKGFGFEVKSRILAEECLRTVYRIVQDVDAPASVRMKGAENLVEWGGLKPKNSNAPGDATPGFTINIVIPQAVQAEAIAKGVQYTESVSAKAHGKIIDNDTGDVEDDE